MTSPSAPASARNDGAFREARVEQLLGRKVRDVAGRTVGRIEELVAEQEGTDLVVIEVHVGPGALLERLVDLATLVSSSGPLQRQLRKRRRIPWQQLDLTDPDCPRLTVMREDLTEPTESVVRRLP